MKFLNSLVGFLRGQDDGIKRRTLRAGLWVGVSSVVLNVLSLARSVVLARLLSPEIFGLWAICMTFVRALTVFSETGFASALIQRQESAETARDTAFVLLIIRGVLLCLIALAVAPIFADFYNLPILQPLVSVLALAFLITGFHNINTVFHQKDLKFSRLVYMEQATGIASFIFVVIIAYFYRSPWALVATHLFTAAITVALSYLIIPAKPRFVFNKKIAAELFHYGKFLSGSAIVIFITVEIDNVIIGKIIGMEALGIYALAYMLANLPTTHVSKIISSIMLPAYSKLQSNLPALRAAYGRTLEFVGMLAIPAAVGLGTLASQIIGVVYGDRWLAAADALRILAVFGCLRAIGAPSGYLYAAIGKPKISFYTNLAKLIVIAILIYPLTAAYGIVGAAYAVTIPMVIAVAGELFVLGRVIGIDLRSTLLPLLRTAVFSALMGAVLVYLGSFLDHNDLVSLITSIIVGLIIYVALAQRDLRFMYAWITSKNNRQQSP